VDLPPALAWLLGSWEGEGRGGYPGVDDFEYREHTEFTQPRSERLCLAYTQHTWLADGSPSHEEAGYLRALPDGGVDLVIAQPAGRAEVHEGTATPDRIELATLMVASTSTANPVTEVRRVFEHRAGDTLWYQLDMAANSKPLGYHCEATLHRASSSP
jgi:hypothetical protein